MSIGTDTMGATASGDPSTPKFRHLCDDFLEYEGNQAYKDVLEPWIPRARLAIATLERYRLLNSPSNPYPVQNEDLWQWYALGRFNDYLLKSFEAAPEFYHSAQDNGKSEHDRWNGGSVTPQEYIQFFDTLGFEAFSSNRLSVSRAFRPSRHEAGNKPALPRGFHPFRHEIVEVIEDADWMGKAVVEHTYWPGLMFGRMLFSRAGVRARCHPGDLIKRIAEISQLYFTYWRLGRKSEDLSHGWGHNSQWRTDFRRDYDTGDAWHFNVDGEHPLGDEDTYRASFTPAEWKRLEEEKGKLSMEESIELLENRCFVRCSKPDRDRWPYSNTYVKAKW